MKTQRNVAVARGVAAGALVCLVPTALFAWSSPVAVALGVVEAAVLALATAYAVYLGIYRFPRTPPRPGAAGARPDELGRVGN